MLSSPFVDQCVRAGIKYLEARNKVRYRDILVVYHQAILYSLGTSERDESDQECLCIGPTIALWMALRKPPVSIMTF